MESRRTFALKETVLVVTVACILIACLPTVAAQETQNKARRAAVLSWDDNAENQRRKLRADIEKALAVYGEYSTKEVDIVMDILDDIGLKMTKAFTVVDRSTLLEKDMPPVVVAILMEKFGKTSKFKEYEDLAHTIVKSIDTLLTVLEFPMRVKKLIS
ncbi:hypothetical protein MTO96_035283 [Rhipicephalus appendiculatus]